jgi:hypothetical protein
MCEGAKTEPNYFKSIQSELPRKTIEIKILGEGRNTLSLVKSAIEARDRQAETGSYEFDKVWVVFDRDSFPPDSFDNAIRSATAHLIDCAWSNEAFEFWYILHFEYRNTGMSRTEYQGKLTELLGEPYQKNDPQMYQKLSRREGSWLRAAERARRLYIDFTASKTPPSQSNPCTTVYKLIEELDQFRAK